MDAAPIPTAMERTAFNPEELRQGYRLACMARPRNDCAVRLDFIKSRDIEIVTDVLCAQAESPSETNPDSVPKYMIALDLGTTTIAMQLMEIGSGRVIDTYCAMNPQRKYGADVLSRIGAASDGYAKEMRESVWKVIHDGIDRFMPIQIEAENHSISICCMCIAGNTTMEHLLMGLSTEGLGKSPFIPIELGLQKCTIDEYDIPVYITPGISTFVGGDIVAGLYHCGLLNSLLSGSLVSSSLIPDFLESNSSVSDSLIQDSLESNSLVSESSVPVSDQDGATLFIDLGTNGEMAIVDGDRIIVTATAAGPAFEGGAGVAVPGSDMIKLTASLLEKGIIDETGLLAEPYFEEGIDVPNSGGIHLKQADIRALQMAKAAVRAGVDILCKKTGNRKVARVYLAGGFGYYLDIDSAIAIGLLPENLRDCTRAVGNTSLAGAFDMGKELWMGGLNEDALHNRLKQAESINLAEEEGFESLYLSYLNFSKAME